MVAVKSKMLRTRNTDCQYLNPNRVDASRQSITRNQVLVTSFLLLLDITIM